MSATFDKVRELVRQRRVRLSQHGFNRITRRGILLADVIAGTANGEPIEDYPDYYTGPAVLVLQSDNAGKP